MSDEDVERDNDRRRYWREVYTKHGLAGLVEKIAELEAQSERPVTDEQITRFRRVYQHNACDGYGLRVESVRKALEAVAALTPTDSPKLEGVYHCGEKMQRDWSDADSDSWLACEVCGATCDIPRLICPECDKELGAGCECTPSTEG